MPATQAGRYYLRDMHLEVIVSANSKICLQVSLFSGIIKEDQDFGWPHSQSE